MKAFVSEFNSPGIIRIALIFIMLSTILYLFGDEAIVDPCPVDFSYSVKYIDGTYVIGSQFLLTYTISFIPNKITEFDKKRTFSMSSEFFSNEMNYGDLRTVSSDVQEGETFTYSQFPITGHLILKYYGGSYGCISSPFIDMHLRGYAVEGCKQVYLPEGDKYIQQSSSFSMVIPPIDDDEED